MPRALAIRHIPPASARGRRAAGVVADGRRALLAGATVLLLAAGALSARADASLQYVDSGQWTFNQDCVLRGDTLFTTLAYGVQAWNVADPAAPVLLDDFYTEGQKAYSVDEEGGLLAVTTNYGRLYLLDAADPADLRLHVMLTGLGSNPDVALRRDGAMRWCYTAGNAGQDLQVRDLTDPAAPAGRGSLSLAGQGISIAVTGDTLLVLARGYGLHAVDVSDPDAPALLGSEPLSGVLANVTAAGGLAAAAAGDDGFYVLDVSDPADPVPLALVSPTVNASYQNLRVKEVMFGAAGLFAVAENAGPLLYDLADPAAPALAGYDPVLDVPGASYYYTFNDGCVLGGRLAASHWNGTECGVELFDVSAPPDLARLGRTDGFDYVRFADADGAMIYACTGHQGIFAHELVGDSSLVRRGRFAFTSTWGADAVGDTVYAASTVLGLAIVDFSDPANPVELGRLSGMSARGVRVRGDVACVAAYGDGLWTVDVSDPAAPALLDAEAFGASPEVLGVAVAGDLAATAERDGGMNLWDIGDPSDILHLANHPTTGRALDVELHGTMAYLVVENIGVEIVDVADPAAPVLLGTLAVPALDAFVEGDLLHLALGGMGAASYALLDPANPALLGQYDTTHSAWAVCASGRHVYAADYGALVALHLEGPTAVGPVAAAATARLEAWPNPFNPRVTIRLAVPDAGPGRLEVFDVAGRRLRVLHAGPATGGVLETTWDGRDEAGRDLASGVYFARWNGERSGAACRLVLVR